MPRTTEAPRARLSDRQAETVRRLTEAAVEEVAEHRCEGLTVRGVARRAGVAPATAYTYFASKNHLLAEVFWLRLRALPAPAPLPLGSPADRAAEALREVALLVADEPNVRRLRARIGLRVHERVSGATDASPAALAAFELAFYGALVQAGRATSPTATSPPSLPPQPEPSSPTTGPRSAREAAPATATREGPDEPP